MEVCKRITAQAPTEAITIIGCLAQVASTKDRICSALCCETFAARVKRAEISFASIRDRERSIGILRLFDGLADQVPIGGAPCYAGYAKESRKSNGVDRTIVDVLGIRMNTVKSHLKTRSASSVSVREIKLWRRHAPSETKRDNLAAARISAMV